MRYELSDYEAMSPHRHPYDKLAANCRAFIKLASIRLWLRVYESTP